MCHASTGRRPIQPRSSRGAPWVDELVSELLRFPAGTHEDQVDVLSLFGRILDSMHGAGKPNPAGWTGDKILKMLFEQNKTTGRYG